MHWLVTMLGIDNESGRWYAFWSGFGSDMGEVSIALTMLGNLRRHKCEVHRCWRLGRHHMVVDGSPVMVCRKHHKDGHITAQALREGGS